MRYNKLPNKLFINNRKRLIKHIKPNSIVIIPGAFQMPRNGDQYYPYRQNSDFFYLTGIEQEKSILLIKKGDSNSAQKQLLFIIKPQKELEIWEGNKLKQDLATQISGINEVLFTDAFDQILHSLLPDVDTIYFNIPEIHKFRPEVKSRDYLFYKKIKAEYPLHKIARLAPIMQELRMIKNEEEIKIIRQACIITAGAFSKALKVVAPGIPEYEIEAEITCEFIKQGASGHSFEPIVASGKNACSLHYISNNGKCKDNELLLMDFGAEYANYSSDLSRTVPVNGKYSKRQFELYNATLRVFKYARGLMKPGTTINLYHKEVCKLWEEEHLRLGLYSKNDIKANRTGSPLWNKYFMHATGHFMGLDVHDPGTRDIKLKPGMVITCEPGIYVPEENIGIRIENDILITKDGNIDLMKDIPIEAEEIEELMT